MSRLSGDELASDGTIFNGYDYHIQVWVAGGIILGCDHPAHMPRPCCNAYKYVGRKINEIAGHEVRS